ncbi:LON peptidase substrate-binding domain-containing protein [Phycisphaerales bacterium AB-hyl4]|uniref:LON peptidase substrate-binding domain-containing protein n=1 Tax=Natronomicrosphaera hydrolytica TaxID=3242702 RepID=A0ABV4U7Q2_9BACT
MNASSAGIDVGFDAGLESCMAEALTIDFDSPVPLFPLANCVLLPHAVVPLHIFEPRYRAMTREALDEAGLVAMAVFAGDGWKQDYTGNPAIREHVCVGYLVRHEKLPGGRFNVLMQGICRAKVVRELEHEPYRLAMLEPTEVEAPMEIDLSEHRTRIESMLNEPALKSLASVHAMHRWLSEDLPTSAMIDLAALTLSQMVDERYAMLAEPDADRRALWLEQYLRKLRELVEQADRLGSGKMEGERYTVYLN